MRVDALEEGKELLVDHEAYKYLLAEYQCTILLSIKSSVATGQSSCHIRVCWQGSTLFKGGMSHRRWLL